MKIEQNFIAQKLNKKFVASKFQERKNDQFSKVFFRKNNF